MELRSRHYKVEVQTSARWESDDKAKILRLFGLKPTGGRILRVWDFRNLSVESLGAGQIADPGRNYFLGGIRAVHFEAFTIDRQIIQSPADGAFGMGPAAGEGCTFP